MEAYIIAAIALAVIGLLTWLAGRSHWQAAEQPLLDQIAEGKESHPASHTDQNNYQWFSIVQMSKRRAGWYKPTRDGCIVLLSQEGDSGKHKHQAQTEQQALIMINEWVNYGTLPEESH